MTVGTVIELGSAYAQLEPEGWVLFSPLTMHLSHLSSGQRTR